MNPRELHQISPGLPGPYAGWSYDPMCRMLIDEKDPPGGTFDHEGKRYYFCSPGCREAFRADPDSAPRSAH